jgi:hypothetical protein
MTGTTQQTSGNQQVAKWFDSRSDAYHAMSQTGRQRVDAYLEKYTQIYNKTPKTSADLKAAAEQLKQISRVYQSESANMKEPEKSQAKRIADHLNRQSQGLAGGLIDYPKPDAVKDVAQNSSDSSSDLATGGSTSADQTVANDTASQHDALIATFSEDGKATGKIRDLPKAMNELKAAGYSSKQITEFANAYCEKQGVPESQRAALVAEAIDKAGQTNTQTLASAGSSTDRQR